MELKQTFTYIKESILECFLIYLYYIPFILTFLTILPFIKNEYSQDIILCLILSVGSILLFFRMKEGSK